MYWREQCWNMLLKNTLVQKYESALSRVMKLLTICCWIIPPVLSEASTGLGESPKTLNNRRNEATAASIHRIRFTIPINFYIMVRACVYNVLWNFCDIEQRNLEAKSIFCHLNLHTCTELNAIISIINIGMKFFLLSCDYTNNTKHICVETKHMSRVYDVVSALSIFCVFTVSVLQQHAEVPSIYFHTTANQTAPTNYLTLGAKSSFQEIPHIFWTPKVYYYIHSSPPPVPTVGQINPVWLSPSHILKIHFNIIL